MIKANYVDLKNMFGNRGPVAGRQPHQKHKYTPPHSQAKKITSSTSAGPLCEKKGYDSLLSSLECPNLLTEILAALPRNEMTFELNIDLKKMLTIFSETWSVRQKKPGPGPDLTCI